MDKGAAEPADRHPRRPVAAVLAVVVRDTQVLLVRRANPPDAGLWGFPGGKPVAGDDALEAAWFGLEALLSPGMDKSRDVGALATKAAALARSHPPLLDDPG